MASAHVLHVSSASSPAPLTEVWHTATRVYEGVTCEIVWPVVGRRGGVIGGNLLPVDRRNHPDPVSYYAFDAEGLWNLARRIQQDREDGLP